jgi:ABC-type nitrate/sulfonate/bicarbonate transport system, ATPase component
MDIVVKKLSKSYNEKRVLNEVNCTFAQKQISCIMGTSGAGKTTLIRILMGLEEADSGEVLGLANMKHSAIFQEYRLCMNLTAIANIRMVCGQAMNDEYIKEQLEAVGLVEADFGKPVREMSGGMKQRVSIVRALLADYDVLFMDEAFKEMDEETTHDMLTYVRKMIIGKTVIMISHHEEEAKFFNAKVFYLEEEKIIL